MVVSYSAVEAAGTTPGECVEAVLDDLAADPAVLEVEPLDEGFGAEDGRPLVMDYGNDAGTRFVVTVDGVGGPSKLATIEECVSFDDGEAFLRSSIQIPAAVWNAGRHFSMQTAPGIWIDGPAILLRLPAYERQTPEVPVPGPGPGREPIGTLLTLQPCMSAEIFVLAQNDGSGGNFVVEPAAFVAINRVSGEPEPLTFVGHLYPSTPSDLAIALPPGAVGLLAFEVERPSDVYYELPSGESLPIGSGGPSVSCGGAGGAAPVVIDME